MPSFGLTSMPASGAVRPFTVMVAVTLRADASMVWSVLSPVSETRLAASADAAASRAASDAEARVAMRVMAVSFRCGRRFFQPAHVGYSAPRPIGRINKTCSDLREPCVRRARPHVSVPGTRSGRRGKGFARMRQDGHADDQPLERLLASCAAGDRAALHAIYRAEAPRMIAVAQRILKRRSLAEDAVQDAFVLIWRNAAKFDPAKGSGLTWIYTVLRNRSLTLLREDRRVEPTDAPLGDEIADDAETPEAAIARLSDAEALRHCLERLEPKRRMAIALAYVHGLSHGELAGGSAFRSAPSSHGCGAA